MPDRAEYVRRAQSAEREATQKPPGPEREELKRRARAYYDIAETLREAEDRAACGAPRRGTG